MRASLLLISESSVSSSCFREVRRSCSAFRAVSMSRFVWAICPSVVVSAQQTMNERAAVWLGPLLSLFLLNECCEFYALNGGCAETSIAAHRRRGWKLYLSFSRGHKGCHPAPHYGEATTATETTPAGRFGPAGRAQAIVWAVCGAGSVGRPPSTCRRNDSIIDKVHRAALWSRSP